VNDLREVSHGDTLPFAKKYFLPYFIGEPKNLPLTLEKEHLIYALSKRLPFSYPPSPSLKRYILQFFWFKSPITSFMYDSLGQERISKLNHFCYLSALSCKKNWPFKAHQTYVVSPSSADQSKHWQPYYESIAIFNKVLFTTVFSDLFDMLQPHFYADSELPSIELLWQNYQRNWKTTRRFWTGIFSIRVFMIQICNARLCLKYFQLENARIEQ